MADSKKSRWSVVADNVDRLEGKEPKSEPKPDPDEFSSEDIIRAKAFWGAPSPSILVNTTEEAIGLFTEPYGYWQTPRPTNTFRAEVQTFDDNQYNVETDAELRRRLIALTLPGEKQEAADRRIYLASGSALDSIAREYDTVRLVESPPNNTSLCYQIAMATTTRVEMPKEIYDALDEIGRINNSKDYDGLTRVFRYRMTEDQFLTLRSAISRYYSRLILRPAPTDGMYDNGLAKLFRYQLISKNTLDKLG